jgi:hypothetical protein
MMYRSTSRSHAFDTRRASVSVLVLSGRFGPESPEAALETESISPAGLGRAAARCRPRRSSTEQNSELSLRAQIVLDVSGRVLQRDVVLLEQRVHLEPRLQRQ